MQENNEFNEWAIIELFGHQKMAGHVTNATIGGASFIRVDVPQVGEGQKYIPAFTRFLGASSIYAINPVSETVARAAACSYRSAPVHAYDIPELRQHSLALESTGPSQREHEDFEDEEENEYSEFPL